MTPENAAVIELGTSPEALAERTRRMDELAKGKYVPIMSMAEMAEIVESEKPPKKRKVQGVIVLDVIVGRDGSVLDVHALNGPEILAQSATDAMRWWRFKPYRVDGQPAVVETTVAVEFKP